MPNGQTNLEQSWRDLADEVKLNGATLLTVFALQQAITAPRDAHTTLPGVYLHGGVTGRASLASLEIFDQNKANQTFVSLEEDNGTVTVVLKAISEDALGKSVVSTLKKITEIDGRDAFEYLKWFVDLPGLSNQFPYKSAGARMQKLITGSMSASPNSVAFLQIGNVFDSLPDDVTVRYSDGSTTTWSYLFRSKLDDSTFAKVNDVPEDGPYAVFVDAIKEVTTGSSGRSGRGASWTAIPDYPKEEGARRGTPQRSFLVEPANWDEMQEMEYLNLTMTGSGPEGDPYTQTFKVCEVFGSPHSAQSRPSHLPT